MPWITVAQSLAGGAVLILSSGTDAFGLVFRALFFVAAVFAGLTLLEIQRSADRFDRLVIPLALVSAAFVVLGTFTLVSGLVFPSSSAGDDRSEEHTSELQSLMRISYAVFCLKKKNK